MAELHLTVLPITQNEVPFMNTSEATKRSSDRAENGKEAKNTHFRATGVGQACHNFEIGGDTIKTMEIVHGWQCQCMQ